MATTCARCGIVLSSSADHCHACGHLVAPTESLSSTQPPLSSGSSEHSDLAAAPLPHQDEAVKVETLLGRIAAQSHFEERYELRGVLASGGMGRVYRAYDSILRREVAIKMMRESHVRRRRQSVGSS